jgi:hypothetical protein
MDTNVKTIIKPQTLIAGRLILDNNRTRQSHQPTHTIHTQALNLSLKDQSHEINRKKSELYFIGFR